MNLRDPNLPFNLTSFRALQDELRRMDAALTEEQQAWSRLGPMIDAHHIVFSAPESRVHRLGGPNAGWGPSGCWGGTAWVHGLPRRPVSHSKSSAREVMEDLAKQLQEPQS